MSASSAHGELSQAEQDSASPLALRAGFRVGSNVWGWRRSRKALVAPAPESQLISSPSAAKVRFSALAEHRFEQEIVLGSVGIQDSHRSLAVIQALDGPIRFD